MKKLFYIYSNKKVCKEPLLVVDSKEAADKVISRFSTTAPLMSVDSVPYHDGDLDEIPWAVRFEDGKVDEVWRGYLGDYGKALNENGLNCYGGSGHICVMAKDAEEAIAQAKALIREKLKGADEEVADGDLSERG